MSQFDFTRDDFKASRPAGARSVDDTTAKPEEVDSTGADKVQQLAEEASAGAVGSGPSKPSDLEEDSKFNASRGGRVEDTAEERNRLAGGARNPKRNASKSSEPSDAELEAADVKPEPRGRRVSEAAKSVPKNDPKAKEAKNLDVAKDAQATDTVGTTDGVNKTTDKN